MNWVMLLVFGMNIPGLTEMSM
ncbi:unnamed protein product [Staurois parvus]|uniref:NADH dehydrogenase subunit 4 n=1 Tax=Staurois parvus TaxID=386267 RepID=A0ABN9FIJ0_9NEOB|nr:unnamed protein product [Staurois parvus]